MDKNGSSRLGHIWLAGFLLGFVLINYPFLQIFNRPESIFGIPTLFFYCLVWWLCALIAILIYSRRLVSKNDAGKTG